MSNRRKPRASSPYPAMATGANTAQLGSGQPWRYNRQATPVRRQHTPRRTQFASLNNNTTITPDYHYPVPHNLSSFPASIGAGSSMMSNSTTSFPGIGDVKLLTTISISQFPAVNSSESSNTSNSISSNQEYNITPVRTPIRPAIPVYPVPWGLYFQQPMLLFNGQSQAFATCVNNNSHRGCTFPEEVITKLDKLTAEVVQVQDGQRQIQLGISRIGYQNYPCAPPHENDVSLRAQQQLMTPETLDKLLHKMSAIQNDMNNVLERMAYYQNEHHQIKTEVGVISRTVDRIIADQEKERDNIRIQRIRDPPSPGYEESDEEEIAPQPLENGEPQWDKDISD